MYWDNVLKEVLQKNSSHRPFSFTNLTREKPLEDLSKKRVKKAKAKNYKIGKNQGSVYFTRREAECMVWLLRGRTINRVAMELNLSPRTVEFYLKNMKAKLGCRTKFELIDLVHGSDFMDGVDFI